LAIVTPAGFIGMFDQSLAIVGNELFEHTFEQIGQMVHARKETALTNIEAFGQTPHGDTVQIMFGVNVKRPFPEVSGQVFGVVVMASGIGDESF
jgi:hypothetical protein